MESSASSEEQQKEVCSSYTYWVRKNTEDAAPMPIPHKLQSQSQSHQHHLGSAWNRGGTWEEKSVNNWAVPRIKELLISIGREGSICTSGGDHHDVTAQIQDVTKCSGDAFIVLVRNKKRFSFTYHLSLKLKLELKKNKLKKMLWGHIDLPDISFGELHDDDDLQMEVRLNEEASSSSQDISHQDKIQICNDLKKLFLQPIREKLLQFEQELKDR